MHARLNTQPNKMKIFKIKLKLPELGLARFARKQFITQQIAWRWGHGDISIWFIVE